MRVLVCIKRVPAPGARINLTADGQAVDTTNLGFTMSPHEECALEAGLGLVETHGGSVTALTVGPPEAEEQLRYAASLGVDGVALVPTDGTDWDPQRNIYRLEPMQDFVSEVNRRLLDKGMAKTDIVVLICRSGDRSSRGANRLADDGFKRVYSVVDGFEGDMSADGRRTVNGWKNAGLPWSYRLDKARMYFPRLQTLLPSKSGLSRGQISVTSNIIH